MISAPGWVVAAVNFLISVLGLALHFVKPSDTSSN